MRSPSGCPRSDEHAADRGAMAAIWKNAVMRLTWAIPSPATRMNESVYWPKPREDLEHIDDPTSIRASINNAPIPLCSSGLPRRA
jgi:hypothetical protein